MCPPAALAIGFGFGALDILPGVVVIAKQFEYGRKILNTVGKLKAKALNFVKDTYDIGKSKLTSAYNSLITKIDNFENLIIRQIDDAFVGVSSGYFDDLARSSDDFVEFANHAKNGTDDLAKIFSSQADEMSEELSEQGLKIGDDLKQAGNKFNKKPDIENIDNHGIMMVEKLSPMEVI